MLAYLFWHRPRPDVAVEDYEDGLLEFQRRLDVPAASFRLEALPFGSGGGYEDWYLVDDWAALGELNRTAVTGSPGLAHDLAAGMAAVGWGGVYELVRGPAEAPRGARWADKPRGEPYESFLASLEAPAVWRRQLVLGPAPELCLAEPAGSGRTLL